MDEQTLTLALNGDVPLREFASAMHYFNSLVVGLASEIAGQAKVEWVIDSLEAGSAIATVRGVTDTPIVLDAIVTAFLRVGKALQAHQPIPYSDKVKQPAQSIVELLNGKVTSVRFETPTEDVLVASHYRDGVPVKPTYSVGTLKGVVEALSRRRGIRFTIYDALFDRPIACYLKDGQEDKVKDFWGKKVLVTGLIGRDAESGKPFAIRKVTQVSPAESSEPGSYRHARGIIGRERTGKPS